MRYRHTQSSYGPWLVALAGILVLGAVYATTGQLSGANLAIVAILLLVAVVGLVFSRLTVIVDPVSIVAAFGVGWPRRRLALGDVVTARRVRNKWWYGWGLRKIPHGWMYNVWGLDAVELELRSGSVFRIGTDEPDALLGALPPKLSG